MSPNQNVWFNLLNSKLFSRLLKHHKTPEKEDEKITKDTLFQMMPYTPSDVSTIQRKIVDHVEVCQIEFFISAF